MQVFASRLANGFPLPAPAPLSPLMMPGIQRHSMILSRLADDPFRRQRKVGLDAQAFAIEVVEHIQQPELVTIAKAVGHEVYRPGHVQRIRHLQRLGFLALQPLAGFDPQVQFQFAADPIQPACRLIAQAIFQNC